MGQIEHDNYPTPDPLALGIVRNLNEHGVIPDVVIEPSSGAGAFVRAARIVWPRSRIIAVDIIERYRQRVLESGANEYVCAPWESVGASILEAEQDLGRTLIVGNPPFSLAQQHIELALQALIPGNLLSFLLRLSFLGSSERAETFWRPHWYHYLGLTPIAGRPSYVVFKKDEETGRRKKKTTTDNSEYGVYHFVKWGEGREIYPPRIDRPLIWKERRHVRSE